MKVSALVHLISWVLLICTFIFTNSNLLTNILIILVILSAISMIAFKKNKVCGYTILYPDRIFIKDDLIEKQFFIENIVELKFKYNGFEGDSYMNPRVVVAKDGSDNFIEFREQGKRYSVEVLMKRTDILLLYRIFSEWGKIKPDFTLPKALKAVFKKL